MKTKEIREILQKHHGEEKEIKIMNVHLGFDTNYDADVRVIFTVDNNQTSFTVSIDDNKMYFYSGIKYNYNLITDLTKFYEKILKEELKNR